MSSDLFERLLAQRDSLLATKLALDNELEQLDALIASYESKIPRSTLTVMQPLRLQKPARVRGVLAAARKAVSQLDGPFNKNQLLAKLIEVDEDFVHKRITDSNIRNALRLLTQAGVIKVEKKATATTCARYVKAD